MDKYKEIRPYYDDEVRPVLDRILQNPECITAVSKLRFPRLSAKCPKLITPLVKWYLNRQLKSVNTVADFQLVVEHYMDVMIRSTTTEVNVTGIEAVPSNEPFLYMSNHRDISLDPAFVNYILHQNQHDTVRIAIGDNLLTKEYASDLMRLNKSFIVSRSLTAPRKIFAAYKKLSSYIRFSIVDEKHSIWIAQREGRAKDGIDSTEPAIIKMLCMSQAKEQSFTEAVKQLKIVPTAISYEYDPCDFAKAKELYHQNEQGGYQKAEQEDIESIALGISGEKGSVDIHFGQPLDQEFEDAEQVAKAIDDQIIANYILHPSNYFAYELIYNTVPKGVYAKAQLEFDASKLADKKAEFEHRVNACPVEHRPYLLANYANIIVQKIERGFMEA